MKNGGYWPITIDKLLDGANLSLRNTKRLLEDSETSLNNNKYSISIVLSILALEEFGKHFLFLEHILEQKEITKKEWHDKFENHGIKLRAWVNFLGKIYPEKENEQEFQNEIKKLQELVSAWQHRKLEALYLDWNSYDNEWFSYDLFNEHDKKKESSATFFIINNFFKSYYAGLNNMPLEIEKNMNHLFEKGKISAWCKECNNEMKTKQEIIHHKNTYPQHLVGFH